MAQGFAIRGINVACNTYPHTLGREAVNLERRAAASSCFVGA